MAYDVAVARTTHLRRVSVIVLTLNESSWSLPGAMLEIAQRDETRTVVIDCIGLAELPDEITRTIIAYQAAWVGTRRQIIVINAPDQAAVALRAIGVDVSTTTDLRFDEPVLMPARTGRML